ncbi:meiosis-specific kinetochore protein [Arvicanthis niloticus]|uniref:meiosis-specific kinetochore protein n=1 Tax=Arvicanthis niloticus TaxID=61156 RepID=UPI001486DB52|nr:meiosis-specific kinetochore protein [Arvicanthis niloticus]
MDKIWRVRPRRVYTRKKRAGERLNLTPTPDLAFPGKTEALPGLKGKGKEQGLRKISEKEELTRLRGSSSQQLSRLSVTRGESLQENSPGKETPEEKTPLLSSVTDAFEIDSFSLSAELVSGPIVQHDVSSCLLSCSNTESCTKSTEESGSSFPSPELFRGSDCLDWEHPKLEDYTLYKNSTLLDTSKAVALEKAPQFANLSAVLSSSSENYEKCHRKIGIISEVQHISPEPKYTLNLASVVENAASEVIFAEKTGPPTTKKTKYKSENESKDRGPLVQTKLSSSHPDSKALCSPVSSALESNAVRDALLPQPLEPVLKKGCILPGNQSKALLTSTPSSDIAEFVIDLSPVQNVSFEELFPNVSNYVNSSEIVPVSSWQESSSNEFSPNTSEICCIIRASPGARQMRRKDTAVKNRCSLPKDVPLDIIMKTNGRT